MRVVSGVVTADVCAIIDCGGCGGHDEEAPMLIKVGRSGLR